MCSQSEEPVAWQSMLISSCSALPADHTQKGTLGWGTASPHSASAKLWKAGACTHLHGAIVDKVCLRVGCEGRGALQQERPDPQFAQEGAQGQACGATPNYHDRPALCSCRKRQLWWLSLWQGKSRTCV